MYYRLIALNKIGDLDLPEPGYLYLSFSVSLKKLFAPLAFSSNFRTPII
jgi:hypothetical protein